MPSSAICRTTPLHLVTRSLLLSLRALRHKRHVHISPLESIAQRLIIKREVNITIDHRGAFHHKTCACRWPRQMERVLKCQAGAQGSAVSCLRPCRLSLLHQLLQ